MPGPSRVVILGAGFGGLYAAKALRGLPVRTVVIDRNNYHLFQPLLYQVATGLLDPSQIAYPIRRSLRRVRNTTVLMAEVHRVDLEQRTVRTSVGDIAYDVLVVATGSTNNYFGIQHLEEHATGLKSLPEAIHIRSRVLSALEAASRAESEPERRRWLSFTVVGAGPTGVETAGAITELVRHVLPREYPGLRADQATVTLVEAQAQVLGTFAPRLGRRAARTLRRKGVTLALRRQVRSVENGAVVFDDGSRLQTQTIVWTAGVRASLPDGVETLATASQSRIPVGPQLTVAGHDDVFVIGDCAQRDDHGRPLAMLAAVAIQQGRHVAAVLSARQRGESEPPFSYFDKGTMATIGRGSAVAEVGPVHVNGLLGWLMWLGLHLLYIAGFRNRAVVIISWAWNFFALDRSVRLILEPSGADHEEDV